jgi:hypothetical protein
MVPNMWVNPGTLPSSTWAGENQHLKVDLDNNGDITVVGNGELWGPGQAWACVR